MASQTEAHNIPMFHTGDRLRKALEFSEVGVEEMAQELGVSRTTVSNYIHLRTSPNKAVLRVWALRCGVPFEWLAYGTVDDGPNPSEQVSSSFPWDTDATVVPLRRVVA